jgi:outer membrane protein assembly factor BamD
MGAATGRFRMSRVRSSLGLALACAGVLVGSGCASSGKDQLVEVASAEDLYQQGMEMLDHKQGFLGLDFSDYQNAIDKFQDIIDNYPYSDYAVLAELRIADAHFAQHQWEEALSYYRDFAQLHPDHEKVPYTIYQRALCHERQSRSSNRDQTQTREAVAALDELITRYPSAPETSQAEVLWKDLRKKLAKQALEVGDFYFADEEYQSAANRYRSVIDEFPGLGLDAEALYKLGVCYTRMNREDDAQQLFEVILENYPGSQIAEAAEDQIPSAR